jgi:3-methyladenine DNA glycosylase AlkC
MTKRIGASSKETVDRSVLQQLNKGILEAATLSECLSVDFAILMENVFPEMGQKSVDRMKEAEGLGITKRMALAAMILSENLDTQKLNLLSQHPSDTVRGWAAYRVAIDSATSLETQLNDRRSVGDHRIRPFADDPHFGVREWAWLALRPAIAQDITQSINLLLPWTIDDSANIRRFAIEVTRPRGVWSKHISALKTAPGLGEALLDRVMEDPSRYVQDSCANWLNDASKSNPDWVLQYCENWKQKSTSPAVSYITRRGLRSIIA